MQTDCSLLSKLHRHKLMSWKHLRFCMLPWVGLWASRRGGRELGGRELGGRELDGRELGG